MSRRLLDIVVLWYPVVDLILRNRYAVSRTSITLQTPPSSFSNPRNLPSTPSEESKIGNPKVKS